MSVERRRYFRITDVVDLSLRVLKPQTPDLKLSTAVLDDTEMMKMVDAELDSLLNALWDSDPTLARLMGLLNQKMNLLSAASKPSEKELLEQYEHQYPGLFVSLSASGIAFDCDAELQQHDRLEIFVQLDSVVTGLRLKGDVVNVEERIVAGKKSYFVSVEFDIETQTKEQLVQYIARRQVKAMSRRERVV